MRKKPRLSQVKPEDTEVELASPPCLINEVDPAYMGLDAPEERAATGKKSEKPGDGRRRTGKVN